MGTCRWCSAGEESLTCQRPSWWLPSRLRAKGRVTSTRVCVFQGPSRAGTAQRGWVLLKTGAEALESHCCHLLWHFAFKYTNTSPESCCCLKLMFSHWICLRGFRERWIPLQVLTSFHGGDPTHYTDLHKAWWRPQHLSSSGELIRPIPNHCVWLAVSSGIDSIDLHRWSLPRQRR